MPTNTDGGTTVSLDNTPQAVDDIFGASFGATEDQIYILDVMANDLGGNAKVLWSIDDTSDDGSADLITRNYACISEFSELGARIWITADGKIAYDTSALDSLPAGQTAVDQFTYAIRMSNGTLSWATVSITVVGTNDAPVVQAVAIAAVEDGAAVTASFSGDDVDTDDDAASLTYAITSSPSEGSVVNNDDGTFTFNPGTDFQDLAEGEARQVSFTYTATDSHGAVSNTATVTVTVTGTNDAPVVQNVAVAADEDGAAITASFSGDDVDSDDNAASLVYAITSDPAEGSVVNNDDGTFTFDPGADFQDLAEGETRQVTFTYSATDSHGDVSNSGTVTVTITGSNDAPVVSGAVLATVDEDDANPASVNLLANASDPDASDDLDVASVDYSVTGGTWAAAVAYSVDAETGALTFDPGQFNALAVSESIELTFTYNVIDGNGGVTPATAVITITGSNDAPDIHVVTTDTASATLAETNAGLATAGTLTVNDPDASDVVSSSVTAVVASGTTAGLGLTNAQLLAMLGVAPTSGLSANAADLHNLTWNFDSGTEAFNYLNAGQSLILTYTVTSSDGNGSSDTHDVTITIDGTNDNAAPTDIKFALSPTTGGLNAANLSGVTFGSFTAVDADNSSWTFSLSGTNASSFTLSPASGSQSSVNVQFASNLAAGNYTFDVTANDGAGGTFQETFTVSIGTTGVDGAASFTVTAGTNIDFGLNGDDIINGGDGDDALVGGQNNDRINGGNGNDQLLGGANGDIFIFNTALSATTNVDIIFDLDAGTGGNADKIHLDDAIFAGITNVSGSLNALNFAANAGGNAATADQRILYDTTTGDLYYDADGSGGGAKILFAHINLPLLGGAVDAADFVVI